MSLPRPDQAFRRAAVSEVLGSRALARPPGPPCSLSRLLLSPRGTRENSGGPNEARPRPRARPGLGTTRSRPELGYLLRPGGTAMPANPRRGSRPRKRPASRSSERRRRIRERFDTQVDRERRRYSGQAWRLLVRELRDRFLERYLPQGHGWVLELGPGPGRFTPTILSSGARVVAVDLSLPMLRALGRRKPIRSRSTRLRRVRAAGEH